MIIRNYGTRHHRPLLRLSGAICLIGIPALANATTITGRLVFVTSELTDATSTDISTYNSLVNTVAALNPALDGITFAAIGSTESTSALANVACAGACASAPIYLVDGTELAASTADFFAENFIDVYGLNENEFGATDDAYAWTGSNDDGSIDAGDALGDSIVAAGIYGYLYAGSDGSSAEAPLYAISTDEVTFTVPTPEPASLSLLLFGGLGTGLVRRLRRNRRVRA